MNVFYFILFFFVVVVAAAAAVALCRHISNDARQMYSGFKRRFKFIVLANEKTIGRDARLKSSTDHLDPVRNIAGEDASSFSFLKFEIE